MLIASSGCYFFGGNFQNSNFLKVGLFRVLVSFIASFVRHKTLFQNLFFWGPPDSRILSENTSFKISTLSSVLSVSIKFHLALARIRRCVDRFSSSHLPSKPSFLLSSIALEIPVRGIDVLLPNSIKILSVAFMNSATHLRRSCFLHSFSVVFLYHFYVIS